MISELFNVAAKVLDRVIPDQKAKTEALLKLQEMEQQGDLAAMQGQIEVNKLEAANPNLFVAGWRPGCGWVCVAGLAFQFVIGPMFTWSSVLAGQPTEFPKLDMGTLMTLLAGMLGLSGLRSYEKLNNAEGNRS